MEIRDIKKRGFLITLVIGIAAIVLASALYVIGINVDYRVLIWLVAFGCLLLFTSLIVYIQHRRHPDRAEGDERTQKLGGMAMFYTWLLSMLFIFILLALNFIDIIKMTASFALFISLAFMYITGLGLTFLFWSRGDVS